jgi:hypothetical protein
LEEKLDKAYSSTNKEEILALAKDSTNKEDPIRDTLLKNLEARDKFRKIFDLLDEVAFEADSIDSDSNSSQGFEEACDKLVKECEYQLLIEDVLGDSGIKSVSETNKLTEPIISNSEYDRE